MAKSEYATVYFKVLINENFDNSINKSFEEIL